MKAEFELIYFKATDQQLSNYAIGTPQNVICELLIVLESLLLC